MSKLPSGGNFNRKAADIPVAHPPQETGIDWLEKLLADYAEWLEYGSYDSPTPVQRLAQALLRLIEEKVIGADETPGYGGDKDLWVYPEVRNFLRAEQRSKLRELLGGAE